MLATTIRNDAFDLEHQALALRQKAMLADACLAEILRKEADELLDDVRKLRKQLHRHREGTRFH